MFHIIASFRETVNCILRNELQCATWAAQERIAKGRTLLSSKRDNFPLRRSPFPRCWIIEQKKCRCWWWSKKGLSLSRSSRRKFSQQSNIFRAIRQTAPPYTLLLRIFVLQQRDDRSCRAEHQHTHTRLILAFDIHSHTWRARVKSSRCILSCMHYLMSSFAPSRRRQCDRATPHETSNSDEQRRYENSAALVVLFE